MLTAFRHFAGYNRWANARLYAAAADLTEDQIWQDIGLFFNSVGGTLNHLLVADRVWMKRFTGTGEHPARLDAVVHDDLDTLHAARKAEDARIVDFVAGLDAAALETSFTYTMMTRPQSVTSLLWPDLLHFFNHQTHHRGQVHTGLSLLTGEEPPSLDMLYYSRNL
jgi:uncharacterized damage-inducible protein DinB